jgi:hypothetical protein
VKLPRAIERRCTFAQAVEHQRVRLRNGNRRNLACAGEWRGKSYQDKDEQSRESQAPGKHGGSILHGYGDEKEEFLEIGG